MMVVGGKEIRVFCVGEEEESERIRVGDNAQVCLEITERRRSERKCQEGRTVEVNNSTTMTLQWMVSNLSGSKQGLSNRQKERNSNKTKKKRKR